MTRDRGSIMQHLHPVHLVSFATAKGPFKALGIIVSQLLLGFCILSSFLLACPTAFSFGFYVSYICFLGLGCFASVLKPDLVWHLIRMGEACGRHNASGP